MPKRTRAHILEDESRKHFNNLVPDNWVIRKPDSDYGIDAEIEIFSKDGSPTGLMFFVQLKATDQKNLLKALKLSFKKDTLRYYYNLDLPVLLVRYHSPTKNIFTRWAHAVDLYYSVPDATTYTINFPENSRWGETTADLIERYLNQLKELKTVLPLPIELSLHYKVQFLKNTYPLKLESKIRELIKDQKLPISLTSNNGINLKAKLTVDRAEVKVSILETNTFVMHNLQGKNGKYDEDCLPYDLLSIVGCSFFLTGRKSIASHILTENLPNSSLIKSINFLSLISSFIGSEKDFQTAINLMENTLATNRKNKTGYANNVFMLVISPAHLRFGCPKNLEKKFADTLLKLCRGAENEGQGEAAGINYYNLANAMRGSSFFSKKQIISWYKRAARLCEEYLKREYYWAEIGGVLFNNSKYFCSSNFYKKALEIEKKPRTIALCADALMFSGKYGESVEYFEQYLREESKPEHEWVLKKQLLDNLIDLSGIKFQMRLTKEARNLASVDIKKAMQSRSTAMEYTTKLEQIFKTDLLCPMMWANLANLYSYLGEKEKGFFAAIAVCLIEPYNLEAWFASIMWGVEIRSPIIGVVVFLAYEKNGEELISFMMNQIEKGPHDVDSRMADNLKELFIGIREHHERHAKADFSVIRLHEHGNAYKEVRVNNIR